MDPAPFVDLRGDLKGVVMSCFGPFLNRFESKGDFFLGNQLPLVRVEGNSRISTVFSRRGDRFFYAAARCKEGVICNLDVADGSRLTGHDDVLAGFHRAGDAGLRDNQIVFSKDNVVGNLNEIIDLCPSTDEGLLKAGSVNGGIGSNFDVVFENDNSELFLFLVSPIPISCIAVATRADDCTGLNDHAVANSAPFSDGDMRVEGTARADSNIGS
ncbi:hypothetical protein SAMD00019534_099910 [Acytostelium subglobosum LB1]|uniref:hypothetical protein n=1 Tax=Acytostelium subglobosum LB1 TaxID=1410327 RepID=UPI000644898E|nr:hypothetical protein SAMD00019534_099910 [Acytostelium subglobosum LB1]GAM26816.1 hypothetical protein SAMD00019534_099910 [Acytostelium subglobosum LB1]|eukprot:XP_012750084.1 hypothetical protein SAMD00019534_099910 [Acytostelium subglobosum LB1]